MKVKDYLSRIRSAIDDYTVTFFVKFKFLSHLVGHSVQMAYEGFIIFFEIKKAGNVLARYDQNMDRSHRINILKGNYLIILIYNIGIKLPVYDLAKNAVSRHIDTS